MEESAALLRLQEIDIESLRLRKEAQELPEHAKLKAAKAAAKKLSQDLTKIVGQRKDLEMDVEGHGRLRKDAERLVEEAQAKLEETTDYRAVADVESRLDILAKRIEKIDFDTDALVEKLVTVERAEKNARDVQLRLDGEVAALTGALREKLLDTQNRLAELQTERESVAASIDPETQMLYNRASKRFNGRGVETLNGNKPSSCRVALQPSQYADIKRRRLTVDECPYCHRILICDWH